MEFIQALNDFIDGLTGDETLDLSAHADAIVTASESIASLASTMQTSGDENAAKDTQIKDLKTSLYDLTQKLTSRDVEDEETPEDEDIQDGETETDESIEDSLARLYKKDEDDK